MGNTQVLVLLLLSDMSPPQDKIQHPSHVT